MPLARFSCPLVVAIPVRNEAERIGPCLRALAAQQQACLTHVVLLLNNCTDDTAHCVQDLAAQLPFGVSIATRFYPPAVAHAGTARREAMEIAAELAGPDGVLLTTDADAVPATDWLSNTLAALVRGADAVCGRALIDPVDALLIPAHLHRDDAAEIAYATLLDHIHDLVDPDPHDPWPRHTEHSGASIAVRASAWQRAGGIPALSLGEDRAFLAALRRVDAIIRHAPDVTVTVSGRTAGRARGGMADTMARRLIRQDEMLDDSLEPAMHCLRRAQARAALRRLRIRPRTGDERMIAEKQLADYLHVGVQDVAHMAKERFFGMAWEKLEIASPMLVHVPVKRADLPIQHRMAERIVCGLLSPAPSSSLIPTASSPTGR